MGGTPSQGSSLARSGWWGVPQPGLDDGGLSGVPSTSRPGWGTPQTLRWGTPLPSRHDWGTPPPPWDEVPPSTWDGVSPYQDLAGVPPTLGWGTPQP